MNWIEKTLRLVRCVHWLINAENIQQMGDKMGQKLPPPKT